MTPRKFKRILQQVADRRGKHFGVRKDGDVGIDGHYGELALASSGIQRGSGGGVAQVFGKENGLEARRKTGRHSHIGERPVNETAHAEERAVENGARRAGRGWSEE